MVSCPMRITIRLPSQRFRCRMGSRKQKEKDLQLDSGHVYRVTLRVCEWHMLHRERLDRGLSLTEWILMVEEMMDHHDAHDRQSRFRQSLRMFIHQANMMRYEERYPPANRAHSFGVISENG